MSGIKKRLQTAAEITLVAGNGVGILLWLVLLVIGFSSSGGRVTEFENSISLPYIIPVIIGLVGSIIGFAIGISSIA